LQGTFGRSVDIQEHCGETAVTRAFVFKCSYDTASGFTRTRD